MLGRLSLAIIASVLLCCSTAIEPEYPYRACAVRGAGATSFFDPGVVVAHDLDENNERVYLFQSDRHPKDGKHLMLVHKIRRGDCLSRGVAFGPSASEQ